MTYEVEGMAVFHDKPALRKFLKRLSGSFGMRIHRTSNEIIEVDWETRKSRSYWRADLEFRGRALVSAGRYFDEFVQYRRRLESAHRAGQRSPTSLRSTKVGRERVISVWRKSMKRGTRQMIHGEAETVRRTPSSSWHPGCAAKLLHPDCAEYDLSRTVWNGSIDRKPALIVQLRWSFGHSVCARVCPAHKLAVSIKAAVTTLPVTRFAKAA